MLSSTSINSFFENSFLPIKPLKHAAVWLLLSNAYNVYYYYYSTLKLCIHWNDRVN